MIQKQIFYSDFILSAVLIQNIICKNLVVTFFYILIRIIIRLYHYSNIILK